MKRKKTADNGASGACKTVFIVEDHPVYREGLAQLVRSQADLRVCGMAADASQARQAISRLKPDLVLVDISLSSGKSGLVLIKELREAGEKAKLLVVSMHDEALYANRVLRAGGDGYIMKQEDPAVILQAIRDVLRGYTYVSEDVLAAAKPGRAGGSPKLAASPLEQLTDGELELLELLGQGKGDKEITRQLGISTSRLSQQTRQIRKKLKLNSTNALIHYATCWAEAGGQ